MKGLLPILVPSHDTTGGVATRAVWCAQDKRIAEPVSAR